MNKLPPNPTAKPTNTQYTFKYFCQNVLPAVYDDSLSYYELLCKLTSKLNEVITAETTQNTAISEIQDLYEQLKTYTQNYFQSLDIQDAINAKLDDLGEKGELASLISLYLNGINVYAFKTTADMKKAETIGIGSICKTLGDTDYITGDGDYYYIRQLKTTDNIDNEKILALQNNLNAVAEKIPNKYLNDIAASLYTTQGNINALATLHSNELGTLTELVTTSKNNVVGAINETYTKINSDFSNKIGSLTGLATTANTSIVGAINEVVESINNTNLELATAKTATVPVNRGGTGSTNVEGARINLGFAKAYQLWGGYTSGTITLEEGESFANYDYIEIFYCAHNDIYSSVKVQHWNNHLVELSIIHHTDYPNSDLSYHKFGVIQMTDTAITRVKTYEVIQQTSGGARVPTIETLSNGDKRINNDHEIIKIQSVVGYKY